MTDRPPAAPLVLMNWRRSVLTTALRISLYLGIAVCIPSAYMAWTTGLPVIAALDVVILSVVFALYPIDRISFTWRAALLAACGYMLALGLLVTVGDHVAHPLR